MANGYAVLLFFAVQWSALTFSVSSLRSASYSADRKRYQTNDYNLDAIIAVGILSANAPHFLLLGVSQTLVCPLTQYPVRQAASVALCLSLYTTPDSRYMQSIAIIRSTVYTIA